MAGCTLSLPKDLVKLDRLDACPQWELEELASKAKTFDHRTDSFTLQCALGTLRSASPTQAHSATAGARICFLLADRTTDNIDRQEKLAAEGVRWGEIALAESTEPDGVIHYYLAVNLGLAIRNHAALAVKNLKRLASELEQAKLLAPGEDMGGPLRVLGMLYLMAPQWPQGIGDGDKALELLNESIERCPMHPLNHIFYARALWDIEEDDAIEKVKAHLEKGYELIERGDWGSARERWLKELQKIAKDAEIDLLKAEPGAGPGQ